MVLFTQPFQYVTPIKRSMFYYHIQIHNHTIFNIFFIHRTTDFQNGTCFILQHTQC
jgi:hypothetical protein